MSNQSECPFCNVNERIIKETELALIILSNPRKVPGHFLVIPKRHIERPWDLSHEEIQSIFELISIIQQTIVSKLNAGCDIRQNYRPFMKQDRIKVDHVHYHVYPRMLEDELYQKVEKFEREMFVPLPAGEAETMAKLLDD